MTVTFQCGHESVPMNYEKDHISKAKYEEWNSTVGSKGSKSMCLTCWINERKAKK